MITNFVKGFIGDKKFYKYLLVIMLPIMLQTGITNLVNMLDNVMIGSVGTNETTGVAVANQLIFVFNLCIFGTVSGAGIFGAQFFGKGDNEGLRHTLRFKLYSATALTVGAILLFLFAGRWLVNLYLMGEGDVNDAAASMEFAITYLNVMLIGLIPYTIAQCYATSLRETGQTLLPMYAGISAVGINLFLNWVLIFGNLGAPVMGIEGAAIATLTARICEFVITAVYLFFIEKRLKFRFSHIFSKCGYLVSDFLRHGTPVIVIEVLWSLGMSVQAGILGHITYSAGDPVAANSIMSIVQQLSTVFLFGVANASGVMVGKSIGEGNIDYVKKQAFTFNIFAVVMGLFAAVFIYVAKAPMLSFYDFPEETLALAGDLIDVMAVITFFVSFAATNIMGVLRGGGDTTFCLVSETVCIWCIALPAAFMALKLSWPVPVVFALMKSDEVIKVVVSLCRFRNDNWIHTLTR